MNEQNLKHGAQAAKTKVSHLSEKLNAYKLAVDSLGDEATSIQRDKVRDTANQLLAAADELT